MDSQNDQRPGTRRDRGLPWAALIIALIQIAACEKIIGIPDRQRLLGNADGGAAEGGGDGGSAQDRETACQEYCEAVGMSCNAAPTQAYTSEMNCLGTCEELPLGKESEPSGNTVYCRREQARMSALSEGKPAHCPAASPVGQGSADAQCGTACQAYCALWDNVCDDVVAQRFGGDCLQRCEGIYDRGTFSAEIDFGAKDDTIQCRIAHLTAAAGYEEDTSDRLLHCGHAQLRPLLCPGESPPCDLQPDVQPDIPPERQIRVPVCEKYCDRMMKTCMDGIKIYDDRDQCEKLCERTFEHTDLAARPKNSAAETNPGECKLIVDSSSDSVECRYWHVDTAWFEDEITHCLHAGPDGGGHCGSDPCVVYCSLLEKSCGDFDTEFASSDPAKACANRCNNLGLTDYDLLSSARLEDTYTCRLHNLVRLIASDDFKEGGVATCKERAVYPDSACP